MPELPEVEASRRLLEEHCKSKRITSCSPVTPFDSIVFSDADATEATICAALVDKTVLAVHRKGKQLWLELSAPPHLLGHFGMTGAFVVQGVAPLDYKEFKVHDKDVISVCVTPDGKHLVTGSEDKTARMWSLEDGQMVKEFKGHDGWVSSVCVTPRRTSCCARAGAQWATRRSPSHSLSVSARSSTTTARRTRPCACSRDRCSRRRAPTSRTSSAGT